MIKHEALKRYKKDLNIIPMNESGNDSKHSSYSNSVWEENVWPSLEQYVKNKKSLIDVGCGNGRRSRIFSNYVEKVVGIDAANLIGKGYTNIVTKNIENVEYVHGDIMSYDTSGEKFDVVYCEGTFYYLSMSHSAVDAFKQLVTILKDNGVLILLEGDWRNPDQRFDHSERGYDLEELLINNNCNLCQEIKPKWGSDPNHSLLSIIRKL